MDVKDSGLKTNTAANPRVVFDVIITETGEVVFADLSQAALEILENLSPKAYAEFLESLGITGRSAK